MTLRQFSLGTLLLLAWHSAFRDANGEEIAIVNPSFDFPEPGIAVTGFDDPLFDVPGWSSELTDAGARKPQAGDLSFPSMSGYDPPAIAWTADGRFYQMLSAPLTVNTEYTLSFLLGNSADISLEDQGFSLEEPTGFSAHLLVGDDFESALDRRLLMTSTTTELPNPGEWGEVSRVFLTHPDHHTSSFQGSSLFILFGCDCLSHLDSVELTADPKVPDFSLADINGDGEVDLADFTALKANFGKQFASHEEGDVNGDRVIDLTDFNILKKDFGTSSAAVPEPASAVLVMTAMAGIGMLYVRRKYLRRHHLA